jgi:hypothetical protein
MKILTLNDIAFDLNELPDEIDDIRFSVLDNSTPSDPDFFFMPLIFIESFNSPAIVLNVNGNEVQLPLDWCIAVGDSESGQDPEILPLTSINERGFDALSFNPLSGFKFEYFPIEITNIYQDVKWYMPKMKTGQLLAVPINMDEKPECIFIVKEVSRQCELIQLDRLL